MSDPIREAMGKAWTALDLHISDSAGYLYDDVSAECVACGEKAPTIAEVKHAPDCFTADRESLVAAIALLDKPHPDTERLTIYSEALHDWASGRYGLYHAKDCRHPYRGECDCGLHKLMARQWCDCEICLDERAKSAARGAA